MTSFLTLFNSLSPDSHIKGKQFEIIAKWFLENDPVRQAKISQVWLWDDYPKRWGKDRGIDLVCEFKDGSHWAVQAKCYRPDNALKKADIDSFLSESNRSQISGRILIVITNSKLHTYTRGKKMETNDIYQASSQKRAKRYEKDWTFKKIFYQKLDEMLECRYLDDLKPQLEWLIFFSEQIDGVNVYQPLKDFYLIDLEYFLYGLLNWQQIKHLIISTPGIKQVDIIKQLNLDKDKVGYFLYTLDKIGVLNKQKQGRYNGYSLITEQLTSKKLKEGWNIFDVSKRLPTE